MTKGKGCATGVDRLTTRADVCTSKGEDCETVEAHNFEFTKHVLDEQHPSSVANTNEPLVSVI